MVASIGIGASFCAVLILLIFRMSKKIEKNERPIIMFDVLIIGGGVSGISCALVLGSAKINFAADKEIGVFTHQNHHHSSCFFNNAYEFLQDHWAPIC
jgi:hypothetical protein